jgi:ferredoxin
VHATRMRRCFPCLRRWPTMNSSNDRGGVLQQDRVGGEDEEEEEEEERHQQALGPGPIALPRDGLVALGPRPPRG